MRQTQKRQAGSRRNAGGLEAMLRLAIVEKDGSLFLPK